MKKFVIISDDGSVNNNISVLHNGNKFYWNLNKFLIPNEIKYFNFKWYAKYIIWRDLEHSPFNGQVIWKVITSNDLNKINFQPKD